MKRSVILECDTPFFPDSAALHPGYNCNLRNTCVNLWNGVLSCQKTTAKSLV